MHILGIIERLVQQSISNHSYIFNYILDYSVCEMQPLCVVCWWHAEVRYGTYAAAVRWAFPSSSNSPVSNLSRQRKPSIPSPTALLRADLHIPALIVSHRSSSKFAGTSTTTRHQLLAKPISFLSSFDPTSIAPVRGTTMTAGCQGQP